MAAPKKVYVGKAGNPDETPKTMEIGEYETAREVLQRAGIDPEHFALINPENNTPINHQEKIFDLIKNDGVIITASPNIELGV